MNFNNQRDKVVIPGNLSVECFEQVLIHFKNDPATLFKCLLVNRLWCRLSVPLLWSHPFEYHGFGEFAANIIQIYIACLPEDKRQILIDESLPVPETKSPLFNYPNYLQSFESAHFTGAIMSWLSIRVKPFLEEQDINTYTNFVQTILGNLLFNSSRGITDLDIVHFDEDDDSLIKDIISFEKANQTLSKLEKFQFDYSGWSEQEDKSSEIISNLFYFMTKCSHNIQHIYVNITNISDQDLDLHQIATSISELIQSQNNLRDLVMLEFWSPTASATIFNALPVQAHSLTFLRLHDLHQYQYLLLLPILPILTKLETLQFISFQPIYEEPEPIKYIELQPIHLKHLHYQEERSRVEGSALLEPILRMANMNLRTLSLVSVTPETIEIIGQNCPNLTHLSLSLTTSEIPVSLFGLLTSTKYLRHFSIYIYSSEFPFATTENLQQFAISFPKSLLYFGFYLSITPYILDFFLKACPAAFQALAVYRPEIIDENLLQILINYANERQSLKKLYLDDFYSFEGRAITAALKEAKKVIPFIQNTISSNQPYSGPVMDNPRDEDLWDYDNIKL
ncbi:19578_t:CDS:2 [Funneliformis geosporum]|uniref:19426_t:CDS:1 n=1 Tax=Funneliformis geosporum TaxID=1117311 RepID=A0A9W4WL72_9GLOM|nr:19578_t:CDS:2 [Funneliformis geosporum]CAI2170282.1 19426_t:CDS:2 [Funneliformis geosporum]